MITNLNLGCWKILRLFYYEKNKSFHLREIARLTKLHEPSTTKALNLLEKEQILRSKKEGNLKKYFLKNNNILYIIFTIFDMEKYEKLPPIRKNAILHYLNTLEEQPIFAILFGSTAKHTYKEESDIDILIITNNKIKTEDAEKEADALTGMKISTFQMTYNNFLKELRLKDDMVIQSAINTGYPFINHLKYYEAKYNERI